MSSEEDVELAWALDDLYLTVCRKCKYHDRCQEELYDCPAIIELARVKASLNISMK